MIFVGRSDVVAPSAIPAGETLPSPAMRRLCELQTIRADIVASLTEWKDRSTSGMVDDRTLSLVKATIQHFTSQLEAIDQGHCRDNRR